MENKAIIGQLQVGDIPGILKLSSEYPEVQEDHDPGLFKSGILKRMIDSPLDLVKVARVDGQVAGFVIATYNKYSRVGYIYDIVVKKEFRGQRIGSQLMEKVLDYMEKEQCMEIWCLIHEDNPKMVHFLKRRDFKLGKKFYIMNRNCAE